MRIGSARPRLLLAAAAGGLLLIALASACEDGDPAAPGATTMPAATTPAATANLDPALVGQLQTLASGWSQASAKITYDFQTTTADGTSTTADVALYQSPPNSRIDFLEQGEGSFIVITRPDIGYFCAVAGGTAQCVASPPSADETAADAVPFFGDFADPQGFDSVIASVASLSAAAPEDVAGQATTCFSGAVAFTSATGDAKWCFAADGLLLLASFDGTTGTFEMRANTVEQTTAADFEAPYEVLDLAATP